MPRFIRPRGGPGARLISKMALAALAALLGSSACAPTPRQLADERGPLRSLSAPVFSHVYDLAYWSREERHSTRLWREALAACRGRSEDAYPNCRDLRMAAWWAAPPRLPRLPALPISTPASALAVAPASAPAPSSTPAAAPPPSSRPDHPAPQARSSALDRPSNRVRSPRRTAP